VSIPSKTKVHCISFFVVLHVKSYLQIDTDPLDSIISYMPAAFPDVL
jgi:hypothetical protein